MEILGKLFGSNGIVKILRLFLFNPEEVYENKEVARHTRVSADVVRAELSMLSGVGFLKRKSVYRDVMKKKGKKSVPGKKRISGWMLDTDFPYLEGLQSLLIGSAPIEGKELEKRLSKIGKMKLIIASGVFVRDLDSRLDLLLVGDDIKKTRLEKAIKNIEADVGRELRFASFPTKEFQYRQGIYDKLIRDVFDYEHTVVLDRLGIS